MKYCSRCVLPDSRPHLSFDEEGVCNACRSFESRGKINWVERARSFEQVISHAKEKSSGYDCLIPVSGGKDSTWQVMTCLDHGLKPLAVTWRTPGRSALGQANLDNLIALGVDHIDYSISPNVEKVFMLEAFKKLGSTAIPMHMALFAIPLQLAEKFSIPLVVWGENSAFEYGAKEEEHKGFELNREWLKHYGVTHGTTAEDWVSEKLSRKELTAYFLPEETKMEEKGIRAIFLGHYISWDPQKSLSEAKKKGFISRLSGPKTGLYDYADIDDDFISLHHFLKWYKFGFTRLFDNLSLEIRFARLSREEAVEKIRQTGLQIPYKDIEKFCEYVGIEDKEFFEIAEQFRDKKIWQKKGECWSLPHFLIDDWSWS